MESSNDHKRLFFGFHIAAPWPAPLPEGRVIEEHFRHMTVAFLGEVPISAVELLLPLFPKPSFRIGPTGIFEKVIFLPKRFSRVVAWQICWKEDLLEIETFQEQFALWLHESNLLSLEKERPHLPHVTVCRKPFSRRSWESSFSPLPLMVTGFHLYESLGFSHYRSLWEYPFILPFEELAHTADIAFKIRGKNLSDLYMHAQMAICFKFPSLSPTLPEKQDVVSIEDVVEKLNAWISLVDQTMGSPIKAVSYHGDALPKESDLLEWEMIVDV